MDNKKRSNLTNPILNANLVSKFFFCWISPLLSLGYRRPLKINDLYNPVPDEEAKHLTDQLEREWNNELKKLKTEKKCSHKPSLLKALVRIHFWRVFLNSLLLFVEELLAIIQPILTSELLKYFNGEINFNQAIIYGTCISLSVFIIWLVHHPYSINCQRYGMRLRIACSGLVYRKTLMLTTNVLDSKMSGRMLNLLSNDAARLDQVLLYLPYFIIGPLQVATVIYLLVKIIDFTFLAGFVIFLMFMPAQAVMAKIFNYARTRASLKTDERIELLAEILNGIKIIKMYCWEEPFKRLVQHLRTKEIKYQAGVHILSAINSLFENDLSCFITYLSVTVFITCMRIPFVPSYLVFAMGYYARLCTTVGFYLSRAITMCMGALVSLRRYEEFLLCNEFKSDATLNGTNQVNENKLVPSVTVKNMYASWSKEDTTTCTDEESTGFSLSNISFTCDSGHLVAVVGATGSGKSSLLMALMREMETIRGGINVHGSLFYVAQEPWIFTSTLKQNILFGKDYDEEKFERVIKACSLDKDIMVMAEGCETIIGEKGINLSGGQRARVSLARALYYDAQVYLIDDPLSAVDTNVAKQIFENCINGYLKSKIKILVTHHVQHLEHADQILILNDGEIVESGKYDELLKKGINLSSYLSSCNTSGNISTTKAIAGGVSSNKPCVSLLPMIDLDSAKRTPSIKNKDTNATTLADSFKIQFTNGSISTLNTLFELEKLLPSLEIQNLKSCDETNNEYDEKQMSGKIGWRVYVDYFKFGAGYFGSIVVMFLFIATKILIMCADYYVSEWATDEETRVINFKNRTTFIMATNETRFNPNQTDILFDAAFLTNRLAHFRIYSYLIICFLVLTLIRSIMFFSMCVRSSQRLHAKMLDSIMWASMRFFDLNPLGRIMNRFSTDMGIVDDTIPIAMFDFLHITMIVIGCFAISIYINYWVLVPVLPLVCTFFYVRNYFLSSSRELKRIEGICRSPIFVHANSTLTGISTIRASKRNYIFNREFETHVDYHTRAYFAFICTQRWFSLRLDLIVCLFVMFAVFSSILAKESLKINSGQFGLLLVYLFQLSNLFYWAINTSCEIENWMTSIERIKEYLSVKTEKLNKDDDDDTTITSAKRHHQALPKSWPQFGAIRFEDVSFTYDSSLPYVFKNLSLSIRPGEKIGVVGRTGAGKSSLLQTLFRFGQYNGKVFIDDVDIKTISLYNLRNKIAIIPQEPTLFVGTVRSNLDPFNQRNDIELWNALEHVQLKETIEEMKGGLNAEIQKSGSNLSVGQKQLICLARAILKRSKILVIDEATANVDLGTDELVQKAIRECFHDCTVLTIAHRLQTIMDCDRILCLKDGKLEKFDSPSNLLNDVTSLFYELASNVVIERKRDVSLSAPPPPIDGEKKNC